MKPNQPSQILFFTTIILTIIFESFFHNNGIIVYFKSMAVPLIFIYFLISNNYQIAWHQSLLFLLCFVGDLMIVLDESYTNYGSIYCFITVYLMLFLLFVKDFSRVKIKKHDVPPIIIVLAFIIFLSISVLNMTTKEVEKFQFYVVYAVVLCIMSCLCFVNYILRPNVTHLFATLMVICFLLSDIFFVFNEYYYDLLIFRLIRNTTQVLAYYFMAQYFLKHKKSKSKKLYKN